MSGGLADEFADLLQGKSVAWETTRPSSDVPSSDKPKRKPRVRAVQPGHTPPADSTEVAVPGSPATWPDLMADQPGADENPLPRPVGSQVVELHPAPAAEPAPGEDPVRDGHTGATPDASTGDDDFASLFLADDFDAVPAPASAHDSLDPVLAEAPQQPASAPAPAADADQPYIVEDDRYVRSDELYLFVDALLGAARVDERMQALRNRLEITQDLEKFRAQVDELAAELPRLAADTFLPTPSPSDLRIVFEMVYDELVGLGPTGPLLRDPAVNEIAINAWDYISVERGGRMTPTLAKFRSPEHARTVAANMSEMFSDRRVSQANAVVSAELPDARVQIVFGTVVASGLSVSIRKHRSLLGMPQLLGFGSLSPDMADFLRDAVKAKANIVVSGGTGSGKTTFINAICGYIGPQERVITIENVFELAVHSDEHVALRTKERANASDTVSVTLEDLLAASLRMRPDRILVGEVRSPSEGNVFLRAINTGHDGCATSLHASDPNGAVRKLVGMLRSGDSQMPLDVAHDELADGIQLIIQVGKRGDRRVVQSISLCDPSLVVDGRLRPELIWAAHAEPGQAPTFHQVAPLRPGTVLRDRMADCGIDTSRWEKL